VVLLVQEPGFGVPVGGRTTARRAGADACVEVVRSLKCEDREVVVDDEGVVCVVLLMENAGGRDGRNGGVMVVQTGEKTTDQPMYVCVCEKM
jgi:hypothetical protein